MPDTIETLGKLISNTQQRDAIHIAVAPVVSANETPLAPGQPIGISSAGSDGTVYVKANAESIGIVDPFLKYKVLNGQRFWLFLYPATITSLRHEWTHPAFQAAAEEVSTVKPSMAVTNLSPSVSSTMLKISEQWIVDYAFSMGISYGSLMEATKEWLTDGSYYNGGSMFEGESLPDEYWSHFEQVTGLKVPESARHSFFSCSC